MARRGQSRVPMFVHKDKGLGWSFNRKFIRLWIAGIQIMLRCYAGPPRPSIEPWGRGVFGMERQYFERESLMGVTKQDLPGHRNPYFQ